MWTPRALHKLSMVKPGVTDCSEMLRETQIIFYLAIFSTFCFLAELGAQKGPKMGSWSAFVEACGHHGADPPPPPIMAISTFFAV